MELLCKNGKMHYRIEKDYTSHNSIKIRFTSSHACTATVSRMSIFTGNLNAKPFSGNGGSANIFLGDGASVLKLSAALIAKIS